MKINSLCLLLSAFILPNSALFALSLKEAPIQHVTLYPNAAKIERIIAVKAGEKVVSLDGLPANFDISQLQYQTQGVEISAFVHSDSSLNKPSGEESRLLQDQIKTLRDQIASQDAIIKAAELQNRFLENSTRGSGSKVRREAYDAFVAVDLANKQKKDLEQRLSELQSDLNRIGDHNFNQRQLKFYLQTLSSGEISISYVVPYARWQPIYKAELDSKNKQLTLTRMAMLMQKTGEDWNNVKLTLSTSQPTAHVQQLNPEAWWVDYQQPQPQPRPMPAPIAMYDSMSRSKLAEEVYVEEPAAPQFPQFNQEELNFSSEFRSNTKTSISSGQQQIQLPLKTEQYPIELSTWVIPKQSDQAMLNVEILNFNQQWPAGSIKLYRDGDFVGQQNLNLLANQQPQINFGVDQQVKVEKIDLMDKKISLANAQQQTQQKYKYIIENQHNYPIKLVLMDAAPQSRNSLLSTVSKYSMTPTQTQWQNQPNINQWMIPLEAKQKFELQVEHQFKYPAKGNTSGF
ncbi:DUF4139 domain-containing protein [Acinetobacter rudis]|uniref:DUF4139 domain-containing protein n=1 Tax=Acinetobacter rudis TaxID=632955 RepID=UPI00333FF4B9